MSLYNALFGVNQLAPALLKILDIDQERTNAPVYPENWNPYDDGVTEEGKKYIADCITNKHYTSGRFRDIYLNEDGTKIVLYTRNGGGNRDSYPHIFEILETHPNYLSNYDDDFDCTYCYYEFSVPEQYKEDLKNIASVAGEKTSPSEKFQQLIGDLQSGKQTKETEHAMNVGKKIFGQINEATNDTEPNIITINPEDGKTLS